MIVTLRTDFYARCAAYADFAQLIGAQQLLIGPMHSDGLRQAIEEPAHRVGLELEEGLSDTILSNVGVEPGALPLLEHALLELWERRRGAMLTLEGYMQTGGVHGALAQRAEQTYNQLGPDQQRIARRALLRLTQPGRGTEDTRRRAPRTELAPIAGHDGLEAVLGRLVDARLLTTGRDETGQEVIDVSHEALIRGWPRLRSWIDADRAGLLIHRRLTDAAHEWDTLNGEPASLYRGARLASTTEWATEHDDDLSKLEHDFLTASQTHEHGKADAARRRTRRLRGLATGLAVLTVAALLFWPGAGTAALVDQKLRAIAETARIYTPLIAGVVRSNGSDAEIDAIVWRVSERANARVTMLGVGDGTDGLKLAIFSDSTSEVQITDLGFRVAERAARTGRPATGVDSFEESELMHAAVPIRDEGTVSRVAVFSTPMSDLDGNIALIRRRVLAAAIWGSYSESAEVSSSQAGCRAAPGCASRAPAVRRGAWI